jgi:hypothetical protein
VLVRLILLAYSIVYHFLKGSREILLKHYNYLKLISTLPKYRQNTSIRDREDRLKEKLKGDRIFLRFISSIEVGKHDFIFLNTIKQYF